MVLAFYALLSNITLQFGSTASVSRSLLWAFEHPAPFLVQFCLIYSLMAITNWFHTKRLLITTHAVFASCLLFSLVSFFKQKFLSLPLTYSDLQMYHEGLAMAANQSLTKIAGLSVVVITIVGVVVWSANKLLKITAQTRALHPALKIGWAFSCILTFSLLILAQNPIHDKYLWKWGNYQGNTPLKSQHENGFFLSMLYTKELGYNPPPLDFSESLAESIFKKYELTETTPEPKFKPDIIVVMSESLFDPLQLKKIKWNRDPIPFIRKWAKGNMNAVITRGFGGGTGNSEFEFLTGNSLIFNSHGVPYASSIYYEQTAIPQNLREIGYTTIAMHPNIPEFYNRDDVYPKIGFDHYIYDKKYSKIERFGKYPSDKTIIDELINSLNKHQNKPTFHFVITYQNHWPYDVYPFEFKDMFFQDDGLNKEEVVVLNSFTKLIAKSDQEYQRLYKLVKSRERPTLFIMFGDHLPSLNDSKSLFTKSGMVKTINFDEMSDEDWIKTHSTPLIIESNFPFKFDIKQMSLNYLGLDLMRALNFPLNSYQQFVLSTKDSYPILPRSFNYADASETLKDYQMMQFYNLLKGYTHLKVQHSYNKSRDNLITESDYAK